MNHNHRFRLRQRASMKAKHVRAFTVVAHDSLPLVVRESASIERGRRSWSEDRRISVSGYFGTSS